MWKTMLWDFIRLLRPEISLLGILCVYIGAVVSGSDFVSLNLILAMIAVFLAGAGSMPFNDFFDYEIDKINHPYRPLASGVLQPIYGLYIGVGFFIISIVLSYFISLYCLVISLFGVGLICFYELFSKQKPLVGNVVVALTTALAFTYGGAVVGELVKPTFFTLIAFFIFFGREILMDVRDLEGDKKNRVTFPIMFGKEPAVHLANVMISVSLIMLFLPFFWGIFSSIWYLVFAIPVALITIYAISLTLMNVKNAGKTTNILRFAMLQGLILFIVAIFL